MTTRNESALDQLHQLEAQARDADAEVGLLRDVSSPNCLTFHEQRAIQFEKARVLDRTG